MNTRTWNFAASTAFAIAALAALTGLSAYSPSSAFSATPGASAMVIVVEPIAEPSSRDAAAPRPGI